MALSHNETSSEVVSAGYAYAASLSVSALVDYENGGIALNDASQGLLYQVWRARILENFETGQTEIWIDAEAVDAFLWRAADDITEVSIAFDQNMRLHVAWVENNESFFYWYDTSLASHVTTNYGGSVITPRITMDDKRPLQIQRNDIVLAYLKNDNLYCRYQRDRYTVEYLRASTVGSPGLIKIGMNKALRLQYMLRNPA